MIPNASGSECESTWIRWQRHAEREPDREAIVFRRAGETPIRWQWGPLISAARRYAAWLATAGVCRGQTCAIISRHNVDFYPVYLAVSALGAIPTVLAYPSARLHSDKFRDGLLGMSRHSGVDWLLTEAALEPTLRPLVTAEGSTVRGILLPYAASLDGEYYGSPAVSADSPALLQHSSGTTGLQKAVALSHRCVLGHVARYGRALHLSSEDRIVSWLPLYHDMGLIAAFHLPLALGIPTVQIDPIEWVTAPILLIEALFEERGTLSWLPNFAFSLMGARLRDEELDGLSLDHVRMLINCSEQVRHQSHELLLGRLARLGLKPSSLAASYAMAEATFAVTQTPPDSGCRTLVVSRDALREGVARTPAPGEPGVTCASSGHAIEDCELRVVDEHGRELGEDCVGELLVRSASLFTEYRNQPEKSAAALRDGWYVTGDLGFYHGDDWYIVGRKKDLIVVAGKNIYPEDIEAVVSTLPEALPGRVVAFGYEDEQLGTEQVHVIMETNVDVFDKQALRARVIATVQQIDVTVSEVHCVAPRWLIKSSSGKPSRSANRERLLAELTRGGGQ